jgi:hypothetical protein
MSQIDWQPLPEITTLVSPSIISFNDKLYAVVVASTGNVGFTVIESPFSGWKDWKIIDSTMPHGWAYINCKPVLKKANNRLFLFICGKDHNLYKTELIEGYWENFKQITFDSKIHGRISIATTLVFFGFTTHVVYSSLNETVEYRRFNQNWDQIGTEKIWNDTLEATVETDGLNEIIILLRRKNELLIKFKKSQVDENWITLETLSSHAFLDISNIVHFGGAYHFAYTQKYVRDDVSKSCGYFLAHTRIQPGLPYDAYIRIINKYTPQDGAFPQAKLKVYRNKLVILYKDHMGSIHCAYWDSADPETPWIGNKIISSGQTKDRPEMTPHNSTENYKLTEYRGNNFGNDLISVVVGYTNQKVYYINLSRALSDILIKEVGLTVDWCTNRDPPAEASKCSQFSNLPSIIETPVYSEIGYGIMALPYWLISQIVKRKMANLGTPSRIQDVWIYTINTRSHYGPGINIKVNSNWIDDWLHELCHLIASEIGLADDPDPLGDNVMNDRISEIAMQEAYNIFNEGTNDALINNPNNSDLCSFGTNADGTRCLGFTMLPNMFYMASSRQHSWMATLHDYVRNGSNLRNIMSLDAAAGVNILKIKYEWIKTNIFKGIEYIENNELLTKL